ncbi:glycoside hydrolase family 3 C-terminal domain-containing protein [Paenibacillus alkaliterrae]|uniref:glycoside hydrolase family 3 C-terminal domain-containing protein n=1 Tax=Paenibacillus alkaliterrae TaxID=320909 RepID=UPI001F2D17EB|nr:glycoside hydrolase family 3 C-terminal domain-containing protein [Paenibacillus alkaliterrae]MCF2940912.1 glycoside hydrolase family 3 C-terminal domain-containing protein [Paenibacillus alkaliterrae]
MDSDSTEDFAAAVEAARNAEVAVIVVGESAGMSGENNSRVSLDLPGVQLELLKAIQTTGTPVVLLLVSGRPLSVPWAAEQIHAIMEVWQLGTEAGHAIADVLFGDYNPSGKLTVTFPRTVGQVPIFYTAKRTGRPHMKRYVDCDVTPLYPFGYGMSYTTFEYSEMRISSSKMSVEGCVSISVRIANVGNRSGEEIVQLYIGDKAASITRPEKELKAFNKLFLEPGESKEVSFTISAAQLGFVNKQLQFAVEPGLFNVWIGPNSAEGLEAKLEVL